MLEIERWMLDFDGVSTNVLCLMSKVRDSKREFGVKKLIINDLSCPIYDICQLVQAMLAAQLLLQTGKKLALRKKLQTTISVREQLLKITAQI